MSKVSRLLTREYPQHHLLGSVWLQVLESLVLSSYVRVARNAFSAEGVLQYRHVQPAPSLARVAVLGTVRLVRSQTSWVSLILQD